MDTLIQPHVDLVAGKGRRLAPRLPLLFLLCGLGSVLLGCRAGTEQERGQEMDFEQPAATQFGDYHALIIGINDYGKWPPLAFAERDAEDLRRILASRYGFAPEHTVFLHGAEATRSGILAALRDRLADLEEDDNLMIFYAGHGQLDPLTETGYWIPADAELYDETTWIRFSTITEYLRAPKVKAKNIVLITDSCYGGALVRGAPTPGIGTPERGLERYFDRLVELAARRSRQVIASGGYEQVPDQSSFAMLLKQALQSNELPFIDLEYLFYKMIYPELRAIGQQDPAMARLAAGLNSDGQFVLVQARHESLPGVAQEDTVVSVETDAATLVPAASSEAASSVAAAQNDEDAVQKGSTAEEPSEVRPETLEEPRHKPTIELFAADQTVLDPGGDTTLRWATSGAAEVEITDLGSVPGSGARRVSPSGTTAFALIARNDAGVAQDSLTIEVPVPGARVLSFHSSAEQIAAGEIVTLSWETEAAEAVTLSGVGAVPLSGSRQLQPHRSTAYTLTAANREGLTVQRELVVEVRSPAPKILSFHSSSGETRHGQPITLSWETLHANRVELAGFGSLPSSGSMELKPAQSRTYTLSALNDEGESAEAAVHIAVAAAPPRILAFDAEKTALTRGQSTTLSWRTADAARLQIEGLDPIPPSGSRTVAPDQTTTYVLVAENTDGESVARRLRIAVAAPPPRIRSFAADPVRISAGRSTTLSWATADASRVSITPIGQVRTSGSHTVAPSATTSYRMIAYNEDGEQAERTISVQVMPSRRPEVLTLREPMLIQKAPPLRIAGVSSQGQLAIRQTWLADLDAGTVGNGNGNDIWFEAQTATRRYITPRNGARLAVVGRAAPDRARCARVRLGTERVSVNTLASGAHLCVKTNAGKYSAVKVLAAVGRSPGTLRISYTTWN